ncbi:MAG: cell wall hydrolase/autolysin [Actinomycetia bacterium]|nr:cell wall hydrolase/autolysin [Actinomycetes bacterium]
MRIYHRGALVLLLATGLLTACGASTIRSQTEAAPPPVAGQSAAPIGAPQQAALTGKVIVIDPGHNGGNDTHAAAIAKQVDIGNGHKECDTTGTASAAGYTEHAYNWDVSNRLKKILQGLGAKVILTRSSDTGVGPCITERAAIGNRAHADAVVSVHADGAPSQDRGFHVIEPALVKGHNDKMVVPSKKLALAIRDAYLKGTGIPYSNYVGTNAIDVRGDLGGLNLSTVPKVFIETGNMASAQDMQKLSSSSFRQTIAQSLADGFVAYFK